LDRKQIPRPGFLDQCDYLGYIYGERRWYLAYLDAICTWDSLHGEIEAFDRRGKHFAVLHPITGKEIKPARKGRRIRV
jgi:hypothetical protein